MKKAFILAGAIMTTLALHAQNGIAANTQNDNNLQTNFNAFRNISFVMDLQRICTVLTVLALFLAFILTMTRLFLDQRIKHSLIDKGISENIIVRLLPADRRDNRHGAIKWFFILAGVGLGLTLICLFPPLGIHSLAMMAFSLAASFLGYYFFTRKAGQ